MRRIATLRPQLRPLRHTKAMLLVNNGKAQATKLHRLLDDGMRTHEDIHTPIGQPLQYGLALLSLDDTRQ